MILEIECNAMPCQISKSINNNKVPRNNIRSVLSMHQSCSPSFIHTSNRAGSRSESHAQIPNEAKYLPHILFSILISILCILRFYFRYI